MTRNTYIILIKCVIIRYTPEIKEDILHCTANMEWIVDNMFALWTMLFTIVSKSPIKIINQCLKYFIIVCMPYMPHNTLL